MSALHTGRYGSSDSSLAGLRCPTEFQTQGIALRARHENGKGIMAKTILITSASSGFGRLSTETLVQSGHKVFAGFRSADDDRKRVADEFKKKNIEVLKLDVTSQDSVDRAVRQLFEKSNGELDVAVDRAGMVSAGISETFTSEQTRNLFEMNVFGIERVFRAILPTMREKTLGLVINVGSILGRGTLPFFGLYGTSKYAVEASTDSYRYELSQFGIDVILVQPNAFPTNMYSVAQKPADAGPAQEYGGVAEIPGKILQAFEQISKRGKVDPQALSTSIEQIIVSAPGGRPDRVVVGLPFGSDVINHAVAPIQHQVIERLGLGYLGDQGA